MVDILTSELLSPVFLLSDSSRFVTAGTIGDSLRAVQAVLSLVVPFSQLSTLLG